VSPLHLGQHLVAGQPGGGQIRCQSIGGCLLPGLLPGQLFPPLHDLQQGVLEVGLSPLEGAQFVLQVRELLGVAHRTGVQQAAVAVLALADGVDLRLQFGHLAIQVLARQRERREPVGDRLVLGLDIIEAQLLGKVAGAMGQPSQLGIQIDEFQQRTLLPGISFHDRLSV
jgi:hypothetical protein